MRELFKGHRDSQKLLNEVEGKQDYVQTLTIFGSQELEMRVAPGIRSIRTFLQGIWEWCFNVLAGHDLNAVQNSNQHVVDSLMLGLAFHRQPIVPYMNPFMQLLVLHSQSADAATISFKTYKILDLSLCCKLVWFCGKEVM
jgi:hypothetical protein